MRILFVYLLILTSCSPSFQTKSIRNIATSEQKSRRELSRKAGEEFKQLHFFSEGRGMMISPGLIELYGRTNEMSRKLLIQQYFGLNLVDGETIGLFQTEYEGHQIGVLGCVACHSGKAAGQFVVGLGNKNIDVWQIGNSTLHVSKLWKALRIKRVVFEDDYRALTNDSIEFARILGNKNFSNLTQGLVPTGIIRTWFYRQAGLEIPQNLPRAAVKVPHMWGYGVKRNAGSFADGGGNGKLPGWAVAVELVANQRPEVIRGYKHKIEHTEDLLQHFLPPKYPFKIKNELAQKGKITFSKTCAKCHGNYQTDLEGLPIYEEPKWIPLDVVKTDADRLQSLDGNFINLVRNNPLKDFLIDNYKGEGYFAPRLEGVWSRFPYLHNGSVPTIMDLLKPAHKRPRNFSLVNAGEENRFDKKNLGLKLSRLEKRGLHLRKLRSDYSTKLEGQSNQGHEFFTDLPHAQKLELIEYLKTL